MWGLKKQTINKSSSLGLLESAIQNRRNTREDRREFGAPAKFPFIDCGGKLVKVDRRSAPDRRISNISVTEHHLNFDTTLFTGKK